MWFRQARGGNASSAERWRPGATAAVRRSRPIPRYSWQEDAEPEVQQIVGAQRFGASNTSGVVPAPTSRYNARLERTCASSLDRSSSCEWEKLEAEEAMIFDAILASKVTYQEEE